MILRSGYSVKFKGTAVLIAFEHYFDWKNLTYVNNRTIVNTLEIGVANSL